MKEVYNRHDGNDSTATYEMTLEERDGGRRTREMTVYRKDFGESEKRLIRFTSPADIAGTGFLNWDNIGAGDDQFLYLPALKRVRRVVSTQKHLRFVNTDFTHEDMERREVELDDHVLTGPGVYNGLDCFLIESTPRDADSSQYGMIRSWIAKDLHLALKIEFFDKRLEQGKTFEAQALKKIDGIWTVVKSTMKDHGRNHSTTLELKSITYDSGVPDSYFTKRFLGSY